jgi:hypothetical protein
MTLGQVPPHPAALVESLRALGYSLEAAVADLVDNSIAAGATVVDVDFDWNDGEPYARILDDGRGMTVDELVEAMRLGGTGPLVARKADDLGRYGLGLKTASFSQCRRLTVATRKDSKAACARWDLDAMSAPGVGWELLDGPAPGSELRLRSLEEFDVSGTLVLWEQLCTGAEGSYARFLEAIERVERHMGMVFQRFIDGEQRKVLVKLNGNAVNAWDPFISWHPATMPKPIARLRDASGYVEIRGYVLPHRDRFRIADEHETAGGPDGWVAQQGFYVYRAGRLIVAGGWLGLGGSREWLRDEASQLARIRVDIANTSDGAWRVDVRKAAARPPASLRDDLVRIALDVRRSAREVYSHRGARGPIDGGGLPGAMWKATNSRRYPYVVKRDHPAVQAVLDMSSNPSMVEAMLLAIERSVPVPAATAREVPEPTELDELVLAGRMLLGNLMALGLERAAAVDRIAQTEPFNQVPGIASRLKMDN